MKRYLFKSARLGFRHWEDADLAPFAGMNADAAVMEFYPKTLTADETAKMIARINTHFNDKGYGLYAVDLLESSTFIGYIGFWAQEFTAFFTPCIEIGWRLEKGVWGRGLASEGAQRCLQYGFEELGFREVYSFTAIINKRSERVMQKIGMERTGEFEHPGIAEGHRLRLHVLYRIGSLGI